MSFDIVNENGEEDLEAGDEVQADADVDIETDAKAKEVGGAKENVQDSGTETDVDGIGVIQGSIL
jgi:hypothetical protein